MAISFLLIAGIGFLTSRIQASEGIRGIPGVDYPTYYEIPRTNFRCADQEKIPGFYADPETDCQAFHFCYEHRMESFLCPSGTIFNQKILACDYWYSSDCRSEHIYTANTERVLENAGHYPQTGKLGNMPSYYTTPVDIYEKIVALYKDESPPLKSPDIGLNYNRKQENFGTKDNFESDIGGPNVNHDTTVAVARKDAEVYDESEFELPNVDCQYSSAPGVSCAYEDAHHSMVLTEEDVDEFYHYADEVDYGNVESNTEWLEENNGIHDDIVPEMDYDQRFSSYLSHNEAEPREHKSPYDYNPSHDLKLSFADMEESDPHGGIEDMEESGRQHSEFLEEDNDTSSHVSYDEYEDIDAKCDEDDSCYSSPDEETSETGEGDIVEFSKRLSDFRDRSSSKRTPLYVADLSVTDVPLLPSVNSKARRQRFRSTFAEDAASTKQSEALTKLVDSNGELSGITQYELHVNGRKTRKSPLIVPSIEAETPILPPVKQKSRRQRQRLKFVEKSDSEEKPDKETDSEVDIHTPTDSTVNAEVDSLKLRPERTKSRRQLVRIVSDADHRSAAQFGVSEITDNTRKSSLVTTDTDVPILPITNVKRRRKVIRVHQTEDATPDIETIKLEKLSDDVSHEIVQHVISNETETLDITSAVIKGKYKSSSEVTTTEFPSIIKRPEIQATQIQPTESVENLDNKLTISWQDYLPDETTLAGTGIEMFTPVPVTVGGTVGGQDDSKLKELSSTETNLEANLREEKDSLTDDAHVVESDSLVSEPGKDSYHIKRESVVIEESLKDINLHHESPHTTEQEAEIVKHGGINSNLTRDNRDYITGEGKTSDVSESNLPSIKIDSEFVADSEEFLSQTELPKPINSTEEYLISDEELDLLLSQLNSDLLAIAQNGGLTIKSALDVNHDIRENIPVDLIKYTRDMHREPSLKYAGLGDNPHNVDISTKDGYEDDYSESERTKGYDRIPNFSDIYVSPQWEFPNAETPQSSLEEPILPNLEILGDFPGSYIESQGVENEDVEIPAYANIPKQAIDWSQDSALENVPNDSFISLQSDTVSVQAKSGDKSFPPFLQISEIFDVPEAGRSLQENLERTILAGRKDSPYVDYTKIEISENLNDGATGSTSDFYGKEGASEPFYADESSPIFQYSTPEESLDVADERTDIAFGNIASNLPSAEMHSESFPEETAHNFQYLPIDDISDVETADARNDRDSGFFSGEMPYEPLYGEESSPDFQHHYPGKTSDFDREVADAALANVGFGLHEREMVPRSELIENFNLYQYPETYDIAGKVEEADLNSPSDFNLAQRPFWYTEGSFHHSKADEISGFTYEKSAMLETDSEHIEPPTKTTLPEEEIASIGIEDKSKMDSVVPEQGEESLFYVGDNMEDATDFAGNFAVFSVNGDYISGSETQVVADGDSSESVGGYSPSIPEADAVRDSYILTEQEPSASEYIPQTWLPASSETMPEKLDGLLSNKGEITQSSFDVNKVSAEETSHTSPEETSEKEDDIADDIGLDHQENLATFVQTESEILPSTVMEEHFVIDNDVGHDSSKEFKDLGTTQLPLKPDTERKTKSGRALDEAKPNTNKFASISTALTFLAKLKPPAKQVKAQFLSGEEIKLKQNSFTPNEAELFNKLMLTNSQGFGVLGNKPMAQPKLQKDTSNFRNFIYNSKTSNNLNLGQSDSFLSSSKLSKLKSLHKKIISMKKAKINSVMRYI